MVRSITFRTALGVAAIAALGLVACAHSRSSSNGSGQASAEAPKKAEKAQKAKPQKGVPPPAGSKMAKVQVGMDETQVRQIMGEPTSANAYITGKQFIPYYYGPDTSRTDWKYKGQGRVIFSRNAYTGQLKVVQIDYDPNESGM